MDEGQQNMAGTATWVSTGTVVPGTHFLVGHLVERRHTRAADGSGLFGVCLCLHSRGTAETGSVRTTPVLHCTDRKPHTPKHLARKSKLHHSSIASVSRKVPRMQPMPEGGRPCTHLSDRTPAELPCTPRAVEQTPTRLRVACGLPRAVQPSRWRNAIPSSKGGCRTDIVRVNIMRVNVLLSHSRVTANKQTHK